MGMGTSIYPLPGGDETKVWYPLGRVWGWGWMFLIGMSME